MSIFGQDFMDFLNELLSFAKLDNAFGYVLFGIVVMLVTTGFLAFLKSNGMVILLTNLILVILFSAIGFFPTWIILLVTILLIIIIFISIRGGSND